MQKVIETTISTNMSGEMVFNPSYKGGIGRRIAVHGQPPAKIQDPI
jgi:hypothetical protein